MQGESFDADVARHHSFSADAIRPRLERSQRSSTEGLRPWPSRLHLRRSPFTPTRAPFSRDAAHLRGYHVAEPTDVSSEQYLGSFACVIEAIVSVIKLWSSLHVHSGIRQMCVVFDFRRGRVPMQARVSRKRHSLAEAVAVYRAEGSSVLLLYAIRLASAWVAAIGPRGRHDIVNRSPSRQRRAYRHRCYCDGRKPDLQVQIYQFARCGLPPTTTTFHIRKIGCLSNIAHTRQMYRGRSRRSKSLRV